jgi:hypothetical protein
MPSESKPSPDGAAWGLFPPVAAFDLLAFVRSEFVTFICV